MGKVLLDKIKQGKRIYGTCITSMAPLWVKAVRSASLDFVFLDTEHIPLERAEVAALCQLYGAAGLGPIVRIPSPDPIRACQMLDAGAEGVLAPYIENVEQVKELVGAVKYRPLKGERLKRVLNDNEIVEPELKEYLDDYNRGNICILNIESVPAFGKLDDLLDVEGVDAVFIGPHDLSLSLGIPEQYDHPRFEETVKVIVQKCRAKNKAVGIHFSDDPGREVKWIGEGVNIIIYSSDMTLFAQKLNTDFDFIRQSAGEKSDRGSDDFVV
ncbi:aldolase/citrate lyase family protein [Maribellus sp. YY47]|uniref:HpcH/HpaI aldolase family protein n=1 Tax=Maribellus sp. YY47 TaxID=2929486 RepID=UPI0020016B02|nr:aldolase/citrate lyase family protein [Maribellus sp. YY47]MCK3682809.1 aldolase/citrate lyase family protein [Maribellus sp. YY47]